MSMQPPYRPLIEPLESRELLTTSVQAYVSAGNLYVLGTAANDSINITQANNQIAVSGTTIATNNGAASSINAASIAKVVVHGNGGNDTINLATVKLDALVYAGSGNDTIVLGTGNDTVKNGGGFDWIYRRYSPVNPLVNGGSAGDIRQGQDPLCQTDAALAEAVHQGHNFAGDIQYLGNNWYQVKLYGNLTTQKVYFDGWTNSGDMAESSRGQFWTVLMQRARLQGLGIDPNRAYTWSQWNALNAKTGGRLYSIGEAIYNFTGSGTGFASFNGATPQALQAALGRGDYVVAQSQSIGYMSADGVVGNHAYAVLAIFDDGGVWKVRLYNPWGLNLDKTSAAVNDGFLTLTWQQFTNPANFKGYYDAKHV